MSDSQTPIPTRNEIDRLIAQETERLRPAIEEIDKRSLANAFKKLGADAFPPSQGPSYKTTAEPGPALSVRSDVLSDSIRRVSDIIARTEARLADEGVRAELKRFGWLPPEEVDALRKQLVHAEQQAACERADYVARLNRPGKDANAITLRDYLAAHAPPLRSLSSLALTWKPFMPTFCPEMRVRHPDWPPEAPSIHWSEAKKHPAYADMVQANKKETDAWLIELDRQREIQWPYYWADLQIAEKRRTEGGA